MSVATRLADSNKPETGVEADVEDNGYLLRQTSVAFDLGCLLLRGGATAADEVPRGTKHEGHLEWIGLGVGYWCPALQDIVTQFRAYWVAKDFSHLAYLFGSNTPEMAQDQERMGESI